MDHLISVRAWSKNQFVLTISWAGALLLACSSVSVGQTQSAPQAEPAMRLNTTGRALVMPVPLRDGTAMLGELVARIDTEDRIWVRKSKLLRLLQKHVKPKVLAAIETLPETAGRIEIRSLSKSGAGIQFDQGEVALKLVSRADLKAAKKINLGGFRQSIASSAKVDPAAVSAYLNVTAGAEHLWAGESTKERSSLHLGLKSAVRVGQVVVENEAGYDGAIESQTCPQGAVCTYQHRSGFKRRNSRVVYDLPGKALRLQAGDTTTRPAGYQRVSDILGVSIEKAPRKLQPGTAGRPTATHSFVVEKPSEAEISANGTIVRRLRLQPGTYDINGLALTTGSNDVEITLIDQTGERRKISRSTYFDRRLLGKGHSEWSLAAGVPSYFRNNERRYNTDDHVASGYYRLGLNEQVTGEVNGQADKRVQMAGAALLVSSQWGFFSARTAISLSEIGPGFGVGGSWNFINSGSAKGAAARGLGKRQSLRFSADYRSDDFRQPGEFLTTASGLIFPSHDYWLKLDGSYSFPINSNLTATLSGRYQFGRDASAKELYGVRGDRYGADLTFSGALTDTVSGSVALGYSNESYLLQNVDDARQGEFRVIARAFMRFGPNTNLSASYDTLNNQSVLTGYHGHGQGIDRWETTVNAYTNQGSGEASFGGAATYYGNRGEVRVSHNAATSDLNWAALGSGQQRTSVRAGASIAFADGKVAIGAPIRGGFAILHPHPSLEGKTITVGTDKNVLAKADAWGPAVVPNLPAYSQTTLPIDVDQLPLGYSLGAGAFDLKAPYASGYALEVGSGNSISAYGTLVDQNGKPVALLAGIAYPAANKERELSVFTNAAGRFAIEGMAPGKWHIEMADESRTLIYTLEADDGEDGLVRTGQLKPSNVVPEGRQGRPPQVSAISTSSLGKARSQKRKRPAGWSTRMAPAPRVALGLRGTR